MLQKANGILNFISERWSFNNKKALSQLCTVLARPHTEYWRSCDFRKDGLEAVQKKFIRLIPEMR